MIKRQVRTVHLRSLDAALIRRGAMLLEDALHTASLPDAGRLLLVRSLDVGRIQSQQSSATLALVVEQRLTQLETTAVHANDPAAGDSIAVYFRDDVEPYLCLALRLANHRSADEWFWQLAVTNWQPNLPREEGFRRVIYGLIQSPIGVVAIAPLMQKLLAQNSITPLLSVLTQSDGSDLLQACGWLKSESSIELINSLLLVFLSSSWINLLQRWIETWGIEDPRSLWLSTIGLIAEQPAFILDEQLTIRSQQIIHKVSDLRKQLKSDSFSLLKSPVSVLETSQTALDNSQEIIHESESPDSKLSITSPHLTHYAGLLFLLPLLTHLGIESFLESNPQIIEFDLPRKLLHTIAHRLAIPKTDSVWSLLGDYLENYSESDLVRSWLNSLRRWCRLNARMGLHNLVTRSGHLSITPTHVDIWFEPEQADIRIRRVGLDLDPGWVPWFGRVIAFHYTGGGHGN